MDNYREIAGKETKLKNKSELLDDTNPEGDAKEEVISSYSSLSPVKCAWRVCVIELNEKNEDEKVYKARRVKF